MSDHKDLPAQTDGAGETEEKRSLVVRFDSAIQTAVTKYRKDPADAFGGTSVLDFGLRYQLQDANNLNESLSIARPLRPESLLSLVCTFVSEEYDDATVGITRKLALVAGSEAEVVEVGDQTRLNVSEMEKVVKIVERHVDSLAMSRHIDEVSRLTDDQQTSVDNAAEILEEQIKRAQEDQAMLD